MLVFCSPYPKWSNKLFSVNVYKVKHVLWHIVESEIFALRIVVKWIFKKKFFQMVGRWMFDEKVYPLIWQSSFFFSSEFYLLLVIWFLCQTRLRVFIHIVDCRTLLTRLSKIKSERSMKGLGVIGSGSWQKIDLGPVILHIFYNISK